MKWGNEKVSPNEQIKNFKEKSLSNCQYFLKIIDSIKPKTVDFSKVREVQSEEDTIANINYTIASARKMGAQVMTLWEHIHEVNPKFIAILMAELEHIQKQHKWWKQNLFSIYNQNRIYSQYIINNVIKRTKLKFYPTLLQL